MFKLSSLVTRTWLATMLAIGFCFFISTQVYGMIYKKNIEDNYIKDFESSINSLIDILEEDPNFLIENIDKLQAYDSHLSLMVKLGDEPPIYSSNNHLDDQLNNFNQVKLTSKVETALASGANFLIVDELKFDRKINTPYILKSQNFDSNGQNGQLYIYGDLSFLSSTYSRMTTWSAINGIFYIVVGILLFYYFQRRMGKPLTQLRDIAYDYAKNDFSKQAQSNYKDELAQLALAMNKMGKSLEVTGAATRQEKELLENIVTSISTGVLYYNQDKTLLMSNPLGDEFLQHSYRANRLMKAVIPEALEYRIDAVIRFPEKVSFENNIEDYYYKITLIPLFDENLESVRGVLVSIQNITKEKRLDIMRNDFINNISHELRTPLVMIQGYSEAILDDVAETQEEKKEMAKIIGEESIRMNRMVNEMLDSSRMEAGFIKLTKMDVNFEDFFENLFTRFATMSEKNNIQLNLKIDPNLNSYFMDEDKMNQVFVNLINNAIRHTSLVEKESKKVEILVHLDKIMDEVLIEVVDNGTGISEEDIPYVFDRFYKADKSRMVIKGNKVGTGIGLSIVKNIVEAHSGFVEVKSKVNEQTRFIIHLPYLD
ncbi:sensor histidine kinase [Carnobacterium pleistocenium]|uniref:sensor histidine kinase n=1 Tax=Carnobacterium pleistocenium TaxID=181073 RepID=UPI00055506B1|nr:ATP-binding protein [Carnobacterium pleistocenium]